MTVADDGTMTVAVDGQAHEPGPFAPPWRRESFADLLDQISSERRCPVRVEVREADGTMFTDIITPARRRQPSPEPEPEPAAVAPRPETGGHALVAVRGEGFVPGEDVAVAIIVAHSDAALDGTAHGLLTPEQAAQAPTGEVILLGRVSGTLSIGLPR